MASIYYNKKTKRWRVAWRCTLFDDTNHPGTDIQLEDVTTGDIDEIQLKATDSEFYVTDWIPIGYD